MSKILPAFRNNFGITNVIIPSKHVLPKI